MNGVRIGVPFGIIPAYAGSTSRWTTLSARAWDHPRIRGEHRRHGYSAGRRQGSSPHTRGAPHDHRHRTPHGRIIPAYAGSTGVPSATACLAADHPRIRGEHGLCLYCNGTSRGSSPHTRGAHAKNVEKGKENRIIPAYAGSTVGATRDAGVERIIPAYAGSTPGSASPTAAWTDHPRIRGEHFLLGVPDSVSEGSSPHTRGAPAETIRNPSNHRDHPRIRGEHHHSRKEPIMEYGSSPHTRGAQISVLGDGMTVRIIPAYAGSTEVCVPSHARVPGSSPHTRGAQRVHAHIIRRRRIIPAYAGSTLGNPCNTKDRRRDYTSFPLPVTHPSGGGGS